ncbi:hypothetical protein TNCV_518811 [Trichonephila clavipes]|nr:hypothetical protein TNCV_518811 [Trichonephila clavipes]
MTGISGSQKDPMEIRLSIAGLDPQILWRVMSSSLALLKTRRVVERCTLNILRAQTFSRLCGVEARRRGWQLRCRPRHLTMAQNYEVHRQKSSSN